MRCFIAILIPPDLGRVLGEVQKKLRGNVKLVEPENLHINLKFLGDVDDSRIPLIKGAMDQAAASHQRFNIQLYGIGSFPHPTNPRVVWVGVNGDFSVQETLERELEKLGIPRESRDFKPHITLARNRFGRLEIPEAGDLGKFGADKIELVKSELKPTGPSYTVIHSAQLK